GREKSSRSMQDSYDEIVKVLSMLDEYGKIPVYHGAEDALLSESDPNDSEGAQFIINEAMKDDERPLFVACIGAITDMASALLLAPEIADKNLTVIWIGGRDYPSGGWEYNLKNDIAAANVVFKSKVDLWQVPRNVYRMMPVSLAELINRVYPCGKIGKYLADNVIEFNNAAVSRPTEYRILGDSPSIGLMLYDDCGKWTWKPAPEISKDMNYVHNGKNRPIRVYETIDSRFILEDLYAKLKLFAE
ncbi:MAG: nucleoside hydrolase, partial [Firmicutes bacterium]|nr:nucleoside hydrolase [Bacillota bacterium]